MRRPHTPQSIGAYEHRGVLAMNQSSRSRLRARERSPFDRHNYYNVDSRFYRSRSRPRSPLESPRVRSSYWNNSRRDRDSDYTAETIQPLDITLPKNFPKPLTCFFWFTNGRCSKRDTDCAYAHWNTGHLAGAPITISTDTGIESVAGKKAREFASDTYRPSVIQDETPETILKLREEEVTRREREVAKAEKHLEDLRTNMIGTLGSHGDHLLEHWTCVECGARNAIERA